MALATLADRGAAPVFNDPYARFRDRSAAICTALGVASALALGGTLIVPTVADAATANPVNTQMPALAGSAAVGSVITLTPGTFANETTQDGTWERCPSVVSTACTATANTGSKYTLSLSDPPGDSIRLKETATNANGSTAVWSNAIGPMPGTGPVNTQRPALAGSAVRGSAITLTPGTFTNETSQDGTWEQCTTATSTTCAATTNTGSKYTLATNDPVGDYIRLKEVATGTNGTTTAWSNPIGPVTAPTPPPPPPPPTTGYTGTCTQTISPGTNPATTEASMTAGQVLCLNTGTYQSITQSSANTFPASGSTSNPIIITSAPGQTATIQGADYINGNYVTLQYLNLDQADTLYSGNGGSNPAPCAYPISEGMQINGSHITIQDDNVYESKYRGVLIGIDYGGSPTNQSAGDIIRNNNLGPAGGCSDSQHLIYADYSSGLQVYDNWLSDDPYGFGVQLYQSDTNADIHSNVFDNVLDATIEASGQGGNITQHNIAINPAQVPTWSGFTGQFVDCYTGNGDTIANNAIYNAPGGFGTCPSGVTITGTTTLTTNPFTGTENSDNYTLTTNTAATQLANYGLWNGQGPPTPNPATSYPTDPTNTATINGTPVPTG
jgi:hypothetical protein